MSKPYAKGLERNEANYTPLTPVSFLAKAASVYPDRVAVIHGGLRRTWKDVYARSRRLDCGSCHEQSAFCAECHQTAGGLNQGKVKPLNHSEPGFKLFTKGSGGGSHAKLAERDIEYCASCHDVEGADPTCMMCHTEKIGE